MTRNTFSLLIITEDFSFGDPRLPAKQDYHLNLLDEDQGMWCREASFDSEGDQVRRTHNLESAITPSS